MRESSPEKDDEGCGETAKPQSEPVEGEAETGGPRRHRGEHERALHGVPVGRGVRGREVETPLRGGKRQERDELTLREAPRMSDGEAK